MVRNVMYFLILIMCAVSIDCGVYGFRGSNPTPGINSIAVPVFQDVSGFSDPTLAERLTEELKTKITSDNTFRIADRSMADGILRCTITQVRDEALVISAGENVSQRKISISLTVIFDNLKKQKIIWEKQFENYGEYNSASNEFSERNTGLVIATERVTEDIIIDLTSNW
jgi:hypothetical protein